MITNVMKEAWNYIDTNLFCEDYRTEREFYVEIFSSDKYFNKTIKQIYIEKIKETITVFQKAMKEEDEDEKKYLFQTIQKGKELLKQLT